MDDKQRQGDRTARPAGPKKPFEPPRLHVYGDISTLTRTVGRTGVSDGGSGNTKFTRA